MKKHNGHRDYPVPIVAAVSRKSSAVRINPFPKNCFSNISRIG
jgi:hypothetical protein